ncbi:MAG: 3-oxoacyl-[acyl-carrier-protein] reductase [Deltaproteobacteria bacterium]|nr:3-oxoacyl-[acyl-carrier-protein] reductase [Deltaproteobacteria bacterium]
MSLPLQGQVAIVTGASRGIGRAIALRLARDGAHVVVNYVHQAAAATEVVHTIGAAGGQAEAVQFDVADNAAVQASIASAAERLGRCDILVNNAGMTADTLVMRLKESDWDRVVAVNLSGTFHCTKAVLRTMVRARYGRIVNLSSVAASLGNAGQGAYAATKAGIEGFTRSMARELASRSITVNAVAPGFVETEMVAALPETRRSEYLKLIPVGRLGTVEEVADAVAFLVRPEAGYITGQVLGVNGGLSM